METPLAPPVLSSSAEPEPANATAVSQGSGLSEEQLYIQYEIPRTIREIRAGRWKRLALQFPDEMLVDAPRVFARLREGLRKERMLHRDQAKKKAIGTSDNGVGDVEQVGAGLYSTTLDEDYAGDQDNVVEEKLCILADTSYGACCVDEVAAEHVDADVVVHYGRACLSPTARLPVIHIFTIQSLDLDAVIASFRTTYKDKKVEKVCLMADLPYSHHIPELHRRLREDEGYEKVFATEVVRDPSSLLPNRTLPPDVQKDPEVLKAYSIFHVSEPPTSLLLILSSRVKNIHIFSTLPSSSSTTASTSIEATTTPALLRRRYALLTRIATVPIFGILINTLSVTNYMGALTHCQTLIAAAGKKSYVFVVGKVNAAKIANFAEIGAWVVIGCWESSLVESKEFYAPVVTPFELEVALERDERRLWGGEWVGNFAEVVGRRERVGNGDQGGEVESNGDATRGGGEGNWDDQPSDDEPPDFDLRTGRYVSRTRPMGRPRPTANASNTQPLDPTNGAQPSSALVQRAQGDVATINGAVSPAAEFLRSKQWQGLGSDHEVAYERDEDGRIRGAGMEEGRSGVARGYRVGALSQDTAM